MRSLEEQAASAASYAVSYSQRVTKRPCGQEGWVGWGQGGMGWCIPGTRGTDAAGWRSADPQGLLPPPPPPPPHHPTPCPTPCRCPQRTLMRGRLSLDSLRRPGTTGRRLRGAGWPAARGAGTGAGTSRSGWGWEARGCSGTKLTCCCPSRCRTPTDTVECSTAAGGMVAAAADSAAPRKRNRCGAAAPPAAPQAAITLPGPAAGAGRAGPAAAARQRRAAAQLWGPAKAVRRCRTATRPRRRRARWAPAHLCPAPAGRAPACVQAVACTQGKARRVRGIGAPWRNWCTTYGTYAGCTWCGPYMVRSWQRHRTLNSF